MRELAGKLAFVQLPCKIISNETWEVSAEPVNYEAAHAHLEKYWVKYPSDQLNELIAGRRDANRGFTGVFAGRTVRVGAGRGNNKFLSELAYAAGAFWHCDAERAIERKARDIRGRLAEALAQLPDSGKCAVHVALETLDGPAVEAERFLRMLGSVTAFDAQSKDLRWIYCHLIQSHAPPDQFVAFDETVHHFGRARDAGEEPLTERSAFLPDGADSREGVHWMRDPP